MANNTILLVNPTPASITVDSFTIPSGEIASLVLADSTTDLDAFVAKGCIAAPGALTNGTASITDAVENLPQLVEKGARKLEELAQPFFWFSVLVECVAI